MNMRCTAVLILSCAIFGVSIQAAPQDQTSKPAGTSSARETIHAGSRNLKVLPKDISSDDLKKLMHEYQQDLGVPCGYCHAEDPQTKQIDFTSDENPVKQTARFMISMTNDINMKYLGQLGDRRYAEPITCGNCHQGQVDPPDFEPKLQK